MSSTDDINQLVQRLRAAELAAQRSLEQERRQAAALYAAQRSQAQTQRTHDQAADQARREAIQQLSAQFYAWVAKSRIAPTTPALPPRKRRLRDRFKSEPAPVPGWVLATSGGQSDSHPSTWGVLMADSRHETEQLLNAEAARARRRTCYTAELRCTVNGDLVEVVWTTTYQGTEVSVQSPDLSRYAVEDVQRSIAHMVYDSGVPWP